MPALQPGTTLINVADNTQWKIEKFFLPDNLPWMVQVVRTEQEILVNESVYTPGFFIDKAGLHDLINRGTFRLENA